MRYSIKRKLFLQIGSLIIGLICLLIIANTFLYKHFYTEKVKRQLLANYSSINTISEGDYENYSELFNRIENESPVAITIRDKTEAIIYSTKRNLKGDDQPNDKPKPDLPPRKDIIVHQEVINDKLKMLVTLDQFKTRHLDFVGKLDNGYLIKLGVPLMAIENSISLANQFTLLVGILLFIIGMVVAYLLSRHFTKPILDMNTITNELKHLNFGKACQVRSKDEIGQLAQSINDMSIELRDTIESLHGSNDELTKEIKHRMAIDEKRKQLLSNVSHELKTPIALLQGYAEGLKLNVARNHNRTDFYLDVIMDEANKMNQLVQTLLNVNQIEFGDIKVHETDFDIVSFVQYVVHKYQQRFEEEGIDIAFQSLPEPTYVHTDQLKIEQVLTNYLNNALRYVDEHKKVTISLKDDDTHIRVEVYNSCLPIPPSELNKLWDSFYKLDKARTRELGGHGLGLSIVKAIMEAMENAYGVSLVEGGIVFWFDMKKVS